MKGERFLHQNQVIYDHYFGYIILTCLFFFSLQIELIDRVDDIYRNTTWSDDLKGYGVQIRQVCTSKYEFWTNLWHFNIKLHCSLQHNSFVLYIVLPGSEAENNAVSQWVWEQHFYEELKAFVFVSWGNLICSTGFGNEWRHCLS